MGKASSGKKVARAAGTSGGRTSRGKTPWGWYSAISVVVILGMVVLVMSRNETQRRVGDRAEERPTTDDHWHSAYGFYMCDQFLGALADNQRDPLGIHTHGDGVIHTHPFSHAASGKRAVTGVFFETMGITVTKTSMKLAGESLSNGDKKCEGGKTAGVVQVFVDGEKYNGDPADIHLEDRRNIVFAFAPEGAEVPKTPPSAATLNNLSDMPGSPGATSSTSQVPVDGAPPGSAPPDPTATSAPPDSTATTTATTATP
ncbi:MAG: hypothetical protein M3394_04690 [Actinomycetota bacterium]|nr:hypothetical protein [Actinomycetota bacterium]